MKNTKTGHEDGHRIPKDPALDHYQSLREKAEKKLKTMPETNIDLGPEGTRRVVHDIQVYQIEFEMQNDELSRSNLELEASRTVYKDLYDYAPVGYITISETGLIQKANLTMATLLGVMRVDLINHPLSKFILPKSQDIYYNMRKQLFVTGNTQRCELQMYRKNKPPFWVHIEATAPEDNEGSPMFHAVISNITERKQAEIYRHLSGDVLEILNKSNDFQDSCQQIIHRVIETTGCDSAGIRFQNGVIIPYYAKHDISNVFLLKKNTKKVGGTQCFGPMGQIIPDCICGRVMAGWTDPSNPHFSPGGSYWLNNGLENESQFHQQICCLGTDHTSKAIIPIRSNQEIIGLLEINGRREGRFNLDMIQALEAITTHIGWAWRHTQDQEKLNRAYDELEFRIEERTSELAAANDALKAEIEERKQAEETLRESEARFRSIIQNAQAGYFMIDRDGILQDVNDAWLKLHGYDSPEQVLGHHFNVNQDDCDISRMQEFVDTLLKGEPIPFAEFSRCRRDGSIGYHTASVIPVWHEGQVVGLEGFLIDITERKRLEDEKTKIEAQYRLIQKAESLERMAGAIAHKFNNLLAVVMGNIDLAMCDLSHPQDIGAHLTEARKSADKAVEQSRLMLTYLGHTPGHCEVQSLTKICARNLCKLRHSIPQVIQLKTDLIAPGPMINCNRFQIQQILINLMTNAWEAIGQGQGTINLSVKTVSAEDIPTINRFPPDWQPKTGHFAYMEIKDTGCGITPENIENLFDPFFTNKFTGRGMGLSVVLGVLRAHKGGITVESNNRHGSVFRVFLPIVDDVPIAQQDKTDQKSDVEQGCTVLLIDDEHAVRKMAKNLLIRLGYSVLEAKDGVEAMEIFRQQKESIHCVLSDLTMPNMDGWQTLVALRQLEPYMPVVLASGYDQSHVMTSGEHSEMPQVFLSKPYCANILQSSIREAIRLSKHEIESGDTP